MRTFLDSSAILKRYVDQPGREEVERLCVQADEIGVSVLCLPESVSALCRLRCEGRITSNAMRRSKEEMMRDIQDAAVRDLAASVIERSLDLLETNVLRASDALQVACALEWKADLFVSSDDRQLAAAKKAGLRVLRV